MVSAIIFLRSSFKLNLHAAKAGGVALAPGPRLQALNPGLGKTSCSCLGFSFSTRPLSENRRAHAKHRRAFFDRDLIIVRHAHRQLAAAIAERALFANLIAHFTQPAEEWSRLFRLVEEWRQSHQADQRQTF